MKYTDNQIQKVREISVANALGVQLNGRKRSICCPFHDDRSPSFLLNLENGYYCFGCNKRGNGFIDFATEVLAQKGVSKEDAFCQIMEEYVDRT